jgi:hypothetical protein
MKDAELQNWAASADCSWVDATDCSRAATCARHTGPDAVAFVAAKPLARFDLSLRHGGCGKQNLG